MGEFGMNNTLYPHTYMIVDMMDNSSEGWWISHNNTTLFTEPATPSPEVDAAVMVLSITGNSLGIVSVALNIAFLFAVHFIKDKKTPYYRLIQNLAVADLFATITFLVTQNWPHGPFAYIDPRDHYVLAHGLSYVFRGTPWMFFTAYLLTLCCLTLNQWVAVCKPWRYTELVTSKVVTWCMLATWLLSSLQLLIPLLILLVLYFIDDKQEAMDVLYLVSHIEIHIWMGFFVLTIVFNMAFDTVVYRKIKQLKMKRRNSSNIESMNIKMKHEAFITLSLLLLASVFCRLPFPLMGIVGLNVDYSMGIPAVELIDACVVFLLYVNFIVDPIIYVTRTREVRKTYKSMFLLCQRRFRCCISGEARQRLEEAVARNSFSLSIRASTRSTRYEKTASSFVEKELFRNGSSKSAACQTDETAIPHMENYTNSSVPYNGESGGKALTDNASAHLMNESEGAAVHGASVV